MREEVSDVPGDNPHRSVLIFDNTKFAFGNYQAARDEIVELLGDAAVVTVLTRSIRGGLGVGLADLADELAGLGHDAIVLGFADAGVTPDNQTFRGFTELAIDGVEPVMTRGVLLDLPRAAGSTLLDEGTLVSGTDLEAAARHQGTEIRPGDTVLIRTGNALRWQDPESYERGPGLGRSAAEWLAEREVHSVGADNVALDVVDHADDELGHLPAHTVLTVRNGIFIIENLNLEELATAGAHEFVFVCLPLKMRGATGSPVRPIALVPHQT